MIKSMAVCFLLALFSYGSVFAAGIEIDGNTAPIQPVIINGKSYAPMRDLLETLGYTVEWNAQSKTIIAVKNDKEENDLKYPFNLNALISKTDNYVFSPFSIKSVLLMLANGTDGKTQQEILQALNIDNLTAANAAAKELNTKYKSEGRDVINAANAIWLNRDNTNAVFKEDYKNKITDFFKGSSEIISNDNAVNKINSWVSENTNGKITKLINSSDFAACLTNAVYFKGNWLNEFDANDSIVKEFTDISGGKTELTFMFQTAKMPFYEDEELKMLMLPYKNGDLNMYMIIPEDINADINYSDYTDKLKRSNVEIEIPKFKTTYSAEFNDTLLKLGIENVFTGGDFSPMLESNDDFFINSIIHTAALEVDEKGTEAAAATFAGLVTTSYSKPEETKQFFADKPFLYFIMDSESKEILFIGAFLKPDA